MKCARLHLQERTKLKIRIDNPKLVEKPRRYCQKRLVNPEHEEDPRWTDVLERFHCHPDTDQSIFDNLQVNHESEDLFLTVQTLKFPDEAELEQIKRPKTSFKYKTVTDINKHRMFVKEPVIENEYNDDDRSSQNTCYYFDDYVKYLFNNDRSRPTSGKSSIFLRGISATLKENKVTQVDTIHGEEIKKQRNSDFKLNSSVKKCIKNVRKEEFEEVHGPEVIENAKITYRKSGKRKSLTISRAQSPETVQVIRVDVVCNNSGSALSDYENGKTIETDISEQKIENICLKNTNFANKYLLTNTTKALDENVSSGAKVTLLCKTFKLSDRDKIDRPKVEGDRKYLRTLKEVTKNDRTKIRKQWLK